MFFPVFSLILCKNLMKMKQVLFLLALGMAITAGAQQTITVNVENPMKMARNDQPVVISLENYGEVRSALVTCNGQEVACQLDDIDLDEKNDELCFLADLGLARRGEALLYLEQLFLDDLGSGIGDDQVDIQIPDMLDEIRIVALGDHAVGNGVCPGHVAYRAISMEQSVPAEAV